MYVVGLVCVGCKGKPYREAMVRDLASKSHCFFGPVQLGFDDDELLLNALSIIYLPNHVFFRKHIMDKNHNMLVAFFWSFKLYSIE